MKMVWIQLSYALGQQAKRPNLVGRFAIRLGESEVADAAADRLAAAFRFHALHLHYNE